MADVDSHSSVGKTLDSHSEFRHRKRCFAIVLNDFYGMMLIKTMNRLSSGCERESAVFTFFSPSFITKSGKTKQNTQPLSLLQLVKTKAVQIELRSDLEESFSVCIVLYCIVF